MRGRGFTMIEVLVIIGVVSVVLALGVIGIGSLRRQARMDLDSAKLRGLHQGLVVCAQNSAGDYPIPSLIDKQNDTLEGEGQAKDTTANVFSYLVSMGAISTELLISPEEANPNVVLYERYEFERPTGTINPEKAMWDPKLSGVLDGSKPGHFSYAAMQIFGERRARWSETFMATQAVLSLRGPEIASVTQNADGTVTPTLANPASNTLRFYGGGKHWSGPVAYNDNHVEFKRAALAHRRVVHAASLSTYTDASGKVWPDLWSYDEPGDPKSTNDYLGIFLQAGDTPAAWKAAWD
jgi:hypothetical protein